LHNAIVALKIFFFKVSAQRFVVSLDELKPHVFLIGLLVCCCLWGNTTFHASLSGSFPGRFGSSTERMQEKARGFPVVLKRLLCQEKNGKWAKLRELEANV
jgi:hypothetical protein